MGEGHHLAYKVRIYLKRPENGTTWYIGEKELREHPIKGQRVTFEHRGKVETGVVDLIAPENWEGRALIPTLTVIQNPDHVIVTDA
jgi:hypothetical protein